jgi:outer membrane protein W
MKTLFKSLLVMGSFASLHGAAQSKSVSDRDMAAFSWEMCFPTSNKFLNESTFKGWRFEYRKGVKQNLTIGVAMSWNAFDEYVPTTTYATPSNSKAITTDMIRQVYTLPLTVITHYYFKTKSKLFEPYVGAGVGAQYAEHTAYMNIYELSETNWGFVARPELGTTLSFTHGSPVKVLLGVGYNISTNKNKAFDVNGWTAVTANVGISFGTAY